MKPAKQALCEALNALLAEWQKLRLDEWDSERSIQLRENIKKLLELIEALEKGYPL